MRYGTGYLLVGLFGMILGCVLIVLWLFCFCFRFVVGLWLLRWLMSWRCWSVWFVVILRFWLWLVCLFIFSRVVVVDGCCSVARGST